MEDDRKALISRIGTFFVLISILLLVLFIASDAADAAHFGYFILGAVGTLLGLFLKRISAPAPQPSKRFEAIRKMQQKRREAQAKKEGEKKGQKKK